MTLEVSVEKLDNREHRRELANAINSLIANEVIGFGKFTLTPNQATTVINDTRFSDDSVLLWSPQTSSAAGALGSMYYKNTGAGQITLFHPSTGVSDRTFAFIAVS